MSLTVEQEFSVFHQSQATLAEGLFIDDENDRVFWVDIAESRVFYKSCDGQVFRQYENCDSASAIVGLEQSRLLLCVSEGLAELDLETGDLKIVSQNPDSGEDDRFRSNDGVRTPQGCVLYGTMERVPTGIEGGIYVYDGSATRSLGHPIGIPNAFVFLDESAILIADSLRQKIFLHSVAPDLSELGTEELWHDFSDTGFTPDGGCTAEDGRVYMALWDGEGIAVLDRQGELLEIMQLPLLRPTNCKLAKNGRMYVSSAREGMSEEQLRDFPLSGSILELQI